MLLIFLAFFLTKSFFNSLKTAIVNVEQNDIHVIRQNCLKQHKLLICYAKGIKTWFNISNRICFYTDYIQCL